MDKNCLNYTHHEIAIDDSGKEHAQWSDAAVIKIYGEKGLNVHIPRNTRELIQM